MTKHAISYNERAWAVDLISEINRWSVARSRVVQSAGGEWGVSSKGGTNTLFPDVLLFGDMERAAVLQGWELKMPDTSVTDRALLDNARQKAVRLGLGSFLVWNAVDAVLYRIDGGDCTVVTTWHCDGIHSREDVQMNSSEWRTLLAEILESVCGFLEKDGLPNCKPLPDKLTDVVSAVLTYTIGNVSDRLRTEYRRSRLWRAHVDFWWAEAKASHSGKKTTLTDSERFPLLASEILLHWIHRFLFAHYLKRFAREATGVEQLTGTVSLQEAERFFSELSRKRDYAQVFRARQGAELLPDESWRSLLAFNGFLYAVRLPDVEQDLFQKTLQSVIRESQRKLAGQFCTPVPLARLLVALTMDNLETPVLDPCCGTGTIARAALDFKIEAGVSPEQAIRTTFASDLHVMPLQFATVALALGESPFETIRVFQQDALSLKAGKVVQFVEARTGLEFEEKIPDIPCIVMNPPFVRFENWLDIPVVRQLDKRIEAQTGLGIDPKADYFVPVVLAVADLLPPGGRLGAVFPNAWLGTAWAETFRKQLRSLFALETVVVSGCGRWFLHADIVTTLAVLRKRRVDEPERDSDETTFAVTRDPIDKWKPDLAGQLLNPREDARTPAASLTRLTVAKIRELERYGFCWTAFFTELSWWESVIKVLIPVSQLFGLARGERRGWDPMFYPPEDYGIEIDYLRPVLKTSASVKRLQTEPDATAFCCSKSMDELATLEHHGALAWIRKFEHGLNKKGKPLTKTLKRSGRYWYEMRPDSVADLAVSVNPGNRLFFIRPTRRAFTNQRLTRLVALESTDLDLCHALLCSLMGCFYLEAIGFGRGLGALDLSASRLKKNLWMLDPSRVTSFHRDKILSTFTKLKDRDVFCFEKEMLQADRMAFEHAVLSAFGMDDLLSKIQTAALELHRIRNAATKQNCKKGDENE